MKTFKIEWLGIAPIDITADSIEQALEICSRHQLDYLMSHLDQVESLRRDVAAGAVSPTYSTLTITGDIKASPVVSVTNREAEADIIVHLFPEAR
ncbi:hypothetical protein [Rhizorhabdus wittichii]|uniref:hypothetical protein n=1 Tax=Rhizorhabdus wittichii TaxID=160791 RepID=UPI0002E38CEB|nr:hypothetical protein [Rhizorhabdus wittichii]